MEGQMSENGDQRSETALSHEPSAMSGAKRHVNSRLVDAFFCLVVLAVAYGLKRHFSLADAQDLNWVLRPLAALVGWVGGISFVQEGHIGFINRELGIIIAPACAGVNFMVVAMLSAGFGVLQRLPTVGQKIVGLLVVLPGAYGLTLIVNCLRIVWSIYIYDAEIYAGWITPERVHRLSGVVLYVSCLCLFYRGARRLLPAAVSSCRSGRGLFQNTEFTWAPLFWYGAVVVGVPLANGSYRHALPRFAEHCLTVVTACAAALSIFFVIRTACRRKPNAPDCSDR